MSTSLLAQKNGDISIVEFGISTPSHTTLRRVKEKKWFKVLNVERDKTWELFFDVQKAITWIMAQQSEKPKVRKITEGSALWRKREKEVQAIYMPEIVNCGNCGSPRHKSYKCTYCDKE